MTTTHNDPGAAATHWTDAPAAGSAASRPGVL